ncbi:MAG: hypothetical protein QGG40_13395, partial [Myxococcota bacterium]|nr:hypothetical protein [Myxococcota bacterium]
MSRTSPARLSGLAAVLAISWGCVTTKVGDDTSAECPSPLANAGEDVSATLGDEVTLDGTTSTSCEQYETIWTWSFEVVPVDSAVDASSLSDNKTATATQPSFTPDAEGDYVLALVVADEYEESSADYVVVSVASGNSAPVADCG